MEQPIERDASCFCCGKDNELGLKIDFAHGEGESEAFLEIPAHFSGWKGITHGGILSMLLDEAMAHACTALAEPVVTGEITVRFLKPVATGARVRLVGKVEQSRGRLVTTHGWIYDGEGTIAAEATARFLRVRSP